MVFILEIVFGNFPATHIQVVAIFCKKTRFNKRAIRNNRMAPTLNPCLFTYNMTDLCNA